jgi:TonB-dependent SusC/RagA subfamily outer membrane receptor
MTRTLVNGGTTKRLCFVALTLSVVAVLAALPGQGLQAQQTGSITGQITNANTGAPIPYAQLSLVGTQMGVLSQGNGRFLILNVPAGNYTVRCEIIGFATQEISVTVAGGDAATANFTLSPEAISLEEVVVTGTAGAARRREVGNSIASVDAARLGEIKPPVNVSDLLQGQVAGLQQFTTEGSPGAGTTIRIRGNNSITQGNTPLIYVDGVRLVQSLPTDEGSQQVTTALNLLNPDDIDRIEVIKGAAATTLYGTEANSGVIQIFTKRGREGPAVWSFQATGGVTRLTGNDL